ncbi:Astacin-like metalloprotease toxin, partial [Stegodyphus mimosarum]
MFIKLAAFYLLFVKWMTRGEMYLGDLPIENPDLFGGDMLGIEDINDKSAIVFPEKLWPNGVVPYSIDKGLTFQSKTRGAFSYYMRSTCIRFVERTDEKDYIRIFPGQGCYSHVGRTGGQQPVSIGQGCNWLGTIIHELGHALGFYHEQNRSDRDEYLIIYWENIKEGLEDQFFLLKPEQNLLLTDFDYDSIMLYGEYTFSKQKGVLKTMAAKKGNKRLLEVTQKG